MFEAERLSRIPPRPESHASAERPYQRLCVAAVAAALDAEVALEIAIAQLARQAMLMKQTAEPQVSVTAAA